MREARCQKMMVTHPEPDTKHFFYYYFGALRGNDRKSGGAVYQVAS